MTPSRDIEEELRAILMGTTEGAGEAMPKGTRVVFAEGSEMTPETPRVAMAPKAVDLSHQPADDMEMAYAKAQDREARAREAFERGGRELVAGLTRTEVRPTIEQPKDAVSMLLAKRKAADAQRAQNNAERLAASRLTFEQQESARKAAEAKALDERDFAYRREHDAASLAQQKENAAANRAIAAAGLGIRQAQEQRERAKDERGRDLPATEVSALSELPVAEEQVDQLASLFERLDMGGMKGKVAQRAYEATGQGFGTGVDEYDAAARLAMQAAGKIVEGGKLAAGDEIKYRKMMPQPGDTPATVRQKAEGMKAFLRELATRRARGFRASGFNVPDELMPAAPQSTGPVRMTFPDGSVHEVAPDEVELARRKGGVPVK